MSESMINIGIVGARGFVGAELIGLIEEHPQLRLAFAASRSQVGQAVGDLDMCYVDADPVALGSLEADAVVLAVPDGNTERYVEALSEKVILDLSSDHRFDDDWVYGLAEHNANALMGAKRISNPGCYATAVQLALHPIVHLLEGPAHSFGVSGYSGAGTTPSARNDPELLDGGITPYCLVGHTHEREITRHLGHCVRFSPHVAPFFRGISVTVQGTLIESTTIGSLVALYASAYQDAALIQVLGEPMPRVQAIVNHPGSQIGGFTLGPDARSFALVCTIDNLLKGAASQAIQNLNLAFGLDRTLGLVHLDQGVMA